MTNEDHEYEFEAAKDLEPSPKALIVKNISINANAKTVKDFFSFCGEIKDFELKESQDGSEQAAFLHFADASEANTARMLTNAVILDKPVVVKSYFPGTGDKDTMAAEAVAEEDAQSLAAMQENTAPNQPFPPGAEKLVGVLTNLLASGYKVSDEVIKRGMTMDNKYAVSSSFRNIFSQAKSEVMRLEDKWHVLHKVQELDQRLGISGTATNVVNRAVGLGAQALETQPGKRVRETATIVAGQAMRVHQDARGMASASELPRQQEGNGPTSPTNPSKADEAAASTGSHPTQ